MKAAATSLSAVALLGLASIARGAGFQVNEQSARGLGSAFAGEAAAAEDASTIFFNPAGLTLLDGTQLVSSGFAIIPKAHFENHGSHLNPAVGGAPLSGGNDGNGTPTALLQTIFLSHHLTDRVWVGLGASTPYGLQTSWSSHWVGRYNAISSSLLTVNVNPTIAVKVTDWLSIGGGADVEYAKARLTNALDMGSICQIFGARQGIPASACTDFLKLRPQRVDGFVKVSGDDWNASYNLGILIRPSRDTRIGLAYRASVHHTLGGQADFDIPKKAQPLVKISGALVDTGGHATVDLPERLALAAFHQLTPQWAILADITWTRWSRFDELVFKFDNPKQPSITEVENWNDSFRYAIGARYQASPQWSFRFGTAYDESPVPDPEHRTARIPDSDRVWLAAGVAYRWTDRIRLDLGYAHLFALGASTNSRDPVTGATFKGDITAHADIVGVGLTYDFGWPLWPPWGRSL